MSPCFTTMMCCGSFPFVHVTSTVQFKELRIWDDEGMVLKPKSIFYLTCKGDLMSINFPFDLHRTEHKAEPFSVS